MDSLIDKAQAMLDFLREHTQEGMIKMDTEGVSLVKALMVKLCGDDWFYVIVYGAGGEVWPEKSIEVYEGIK